MVASPQITGCELFCRLRVGKRGVIFPYGPLNARAGRPAALLLTQILPVFSVVAPGRRGASPVSVRRQTCTTGC
jgi:hypothetical protein